MIRLKHNHSTDKVHNFGHVDIFLTTEQAKELLIQLGLGISYSNS